MRLVVFGATGGTGRKVVERALAAGHEVVAVARRPEAIATRHERLRVAKGDVLEAESVAAALAGGDATVITIGPADNKNPGSLISEGVKNILRGCVRSGVKRLVFESGLMLSEGSELSLAGRVGIRIYRFLFRKLHHDKVIAERAIRESALEWVIVRPPALDSRPPRRSYIAGPAARVNPATTVSHEDVADCLVKATSEPAWSQQVVNVGY